MMDYESEQQLAYTTAQLLRAAMWAGGLNLLLMAAAVYLAAPAWLAALALLAGSIGCFLQLRLAFDARLFAGFAEGRQTPAQLDAALSALGLRKAVAPRSMQARCRGALRLLRVWLCALALELVLVLCLLFAAAVAPLSASLSF